MALPPRHRRLLFLLHSRGPLSRTELVERLHIRRNTLYDDVAGLLDQRLIRETDPRAARVGRPRTPLCIDPDARHVIGVSFQPGCVEVGRFNLLGEPLGQTASRKVNARSAVRRAGELLDRLRDRDTVAVGVCVPGFIDRERQEVAFSIVFPHHKPIALRPIHDAADDLPVVVETEAHAVAARWLLAHACAPQQDTLLIYFTDGSLGAAFIVHGRPNRGCISSANELGHTRLPVATPPCYCGATGGPDGGCLERLCDSADLRNHGLPMDLPDALRRDRVDHPAMVRMVGLLALGFANAINFTRAGHVILASQLPHSTALIDRLIADTRQRLLPQLQQRVRFDPWPEADARSAHTAAHLALTGLYFEHW